jgi:hypothetical protein
MKTFADLKRRCLPGIALELTYHHMFSDPTVINGNGGTTTLAPKLAVGMVRTISRSQTNAITFTMESGRESWLYWPKAADVRIDDENSFSILENGKPIISYRFV